MDALDQIPDHWFVEHSGEARVVDYEKVGPLIAAAKAVLKQWQYASLSHQPMIDELVNLREKLT